MKESLKKLMDLLPDDADGAIITSDLNRRYLTDMKSSAGTLVFTRTAAAFIIDFRYIEKARSVITDYPVILQDGLFTQIASFFAEQKASRISIEADTMTMSEYHSFCEKMPSLTLLSDNRLSDTVNKLRAHKTPEEISFIQSAQDITDKTFSHILDFIKPGVTEREVAVEMEYFMRKNGASSLAFDSIVVSGVNSSLPHGVPSDKKIENGYRYEKCITIDKDSGDIKEYREKQRAFSLQEIINILQGAGFQKITCYADFERAPADVNHFGIFICQKS